MMGYSRVSYSQFSMWNSCPWKWKLAYIDKIKEDKPSIHLAFGTAMHYTIQMYLTSLYTVGPKEADHLDLLLILRETLAKEYNKQKKHYEKYSLKDISDEAVRAEMLEQTFEEYLPKKDMIEFYYDGEKIIKWFLKNRREFFNSVDEELVGIEIPITEELKPGLHFIAYIDVLVRNKKTGKLRIIDLKTSTKGWNSYKKNDSNTTDQLVLYKNFYASKMNVDIKKIDVEFIILKRKLYEDIPYKQKRVLKFVPAAGKPTINKTMGRFNSFLESCFDEKGKKKLDGFYPKIATDSNCRFCPFAGRPDLCDRKN